MSASEYTPSSTRWTFGIFFGLFIGSFMLLCYALFMSIRIYKYCITTIAKITSKSMKAGGEGNEYSMTVEYKDYRTKEYTYEIIEKFIVNVIKSRQHIPHVIIYLCAEYVGQSFQCYYGMFSHNIEVEENIFNEYDQNDEIKIKYDQKYKNIQLYDEEQDSFVTVFFASTLSILATAFCIVFIIISIFVFLTLFIWIPSKNRGPLDETGMYIFIIALGTSVVELLIILCFCWRKKRNVSIEQLQFE
eukprot:515527_1